MKTALFRYSLFDENNEPVGRPALNPSKIFSNISWHIPDAFQNAINNTFL